MNMKKITVFVALSALSSTALAETGFYLGGKLGGSYIQSRDMQEERSEPGVYENSIFSNESKTVFNVGARLGYDFKSQFDVPVRIEVDYTYRGNAKMNHSEVAYHISGGTTTSSYDNIDSKIKLSTLMVNTYYSFYNSSDFTPYLGIGLGAGFVKDIGDEDTLSKTKFTWSANAGLNYKITDNISADLEYRYIDSGKVTYSSNDGVESIYGSAKYNSHDLSIGIRYSF